MLLSNSLRDSLRMVRRTTGEQGRTVMSEAAIGHIGDLAAYAAAKNLDTAGEFLTDLLAVVCTRVGSMSAEDLLRSEELQMRALQILCDLDRSGALDRRDPDHPAANQERKSSAL